MGCISRSINNTLFQKCLSKPAIVTTLTWEQVPLTIMELASEETCARVGSQGPIHTYLEASPIDYNGSYL